MRLISIESVHNWFRGTQWLIFCDDISAVFLLNRLENQVLDTHGGHLKIKKTTKRHPKTSKDLMCFSVQMLCSGFCSGDMG